MVTEQDAVKYLVRLLEQGCELYERLHHSSVERRKPGSPVGRPVPKPDPNTATPEEVEEWAVEDMDCSDCLREWQRDRDIICFELQYLIGHIHDLLVGSLARWVSNLPEQARPGVFEPDRLILAYSGNENRWETEISLWERGDWQGLLRGGFIDPKEYFTLVRDFPAGNPKFPDMSKGGPRSPRHPLCSDDVAAAREGTDGTPPVRVGVEFGRNGAAPSCCLDCGCPVENEAMSEEDFLKTLEELQ